MYIFVFGVVGTIITFSVVAPLTYLANKNNLFYFTVFDKKSFQDETQIHKLPSHPKSNNSLYILNETTQLSSHLMLNSYFITPENNKTVFTNGELNQTSHIENIHDIYNMTINQSLSSLKDKIENKINGNDDDDILNQQSIINFSMKDILLFSAVISATDTVAALTFIKEDKDPKLFAILFGEGVLNDAVCIVLYRIIKEFTKSNEGDQIKFYIYTLN